MESIQKKQVNWLSMITRYQQLYSISSVIQAACAEIAELEHRQVDCKQAKPLVGFAGQLTYLCLTFVDSGYAIADMTGQISEYCLEGTDPYAETDRLCGYFGPLNYYCLIGQDHWQHLVTGERLTLDASKFKDWLSENHPRFDEHSTDEDEITTDGWIGIDEQRFRPYRNWRAKGQQCGSYASAVMLAYYQDYLDESIVPSKIRKPHATDETLIQMLVIFIQARGFPTVPLQVSWGLNRFFQHYHCSQLALFTPYGSWHAATRKINQNKPVIIGLLKILGSSYGNHWVTAYAYQRTESGARYYKIHDNWGNYCKVIAANWTNGTVNLR